MSPNFTASQKVNNLASIFDPSHFNTRSGFKMEQSIVNLKHPP